MKTVHIMGLGWGWYLCPKEGEIWSVNDGGSFRKVSLLFWMDRGLYKDTNLDDPDDLIKLEKRTLCGLDRLENIDHSVKLVATEENTPVVTTRHFDDIPNCIVFPLSEIVDAFGVDFFDTSIDYMIAYALYNGYNDIQLYGVNMGHTKIAHENSSISFWVGMAMGMGCNVAIHGSFSRLLQTKSRKLYAYPEEQWIQRDKGMQRKL